MYYISELSADDIQQVKRYGKPPGKRTGHYGRHCRQTLGIWSRRAHIYDVTFPGRERKRPGRVDVTIPAVVAHEVWDEANRKDNSMQDRVNTMLANNGMPDNYITHPVVQAHHTADDPVMPYGIFMGGVPW